MLCVCMCVVKFQCLPSHVASLSAQVNTWFLFWMSTFTRKVLFWWLCVRMFHKAVIVKKFEVVCHMYSWLSYTCSHYRISHFDISHFVVNSFAFPTFWTEKLSRLCLYIFRLWFNFLAFKREHNLYVLIYQTLS